MESLDIRGFSESIQDLKIVKCFVTPADECHSAAARRESLRLRNVTSCVSRQQGYPQNWRPEANRFGDAICMLSGRRCLLSQPTRREPVPVIKARERFDVGEGEFSSRGNGRQREMKLAVER